MQSTRTRLLIVLFIGLATVVTGCGGTARSSSSSSRPSRPSGNDITGHWSGTWTGFGIVDVAREESATAEFTQDGRRGTGVIVLDGTIAAESIPVALRRA